ncbi:hypothetical protein OC845_005969 [Tilletia horrida]|nr:hypothetical protein OC845_005969 [Tilletia horrida]
MVFHLAFTKRQRGRYQKKITLITDVAVLDKERKYEAKVLKSQDGFIIFSFVGGACVVLLTGGCGLLLLGIGFGCRQVFRASARNKRQLLAGEVERRQLKVIAVNGKDEAAATAAALAAVAHMPGFGQLAYSISSTPIPTVRTVAIPFSDQGANAAMQPAVIGFQQQNYQQATVGSRHGGAPAVAQMTESNYATWTSVPHATVTRVAEQVSYPISTSFNPQQQPQLQYHKDATTPGSNYSTKKETWSAVESPTSPVNPLLSFA